MDFTRLKHILAMQPCDQEFTVCGWVRTRRDSRGISFVALNDGSTIRDLQIVIGKDLPGWSDTVPRITTGCSLVVTGSLVASPARGQQVELRAGQVHVVGDSPPEYMLQKKRHSFEFLREITHLRPRTNTFGAIARVRSTLSFAIHRFFQERDFIQVHTPVITGSDCEGAGAMFQVTTLPLDDLPRQDGRTDYTRDFFGRRAALTVSGQLEGEACACALKNIYTFGPTFRAEQSNTSRHLAEFWMVEPEMAFCDLAGNMDTAEEFLKYIFTAVLEQCPEDMQFFDARISPGVIENLEQIIARPFRRITYTEAVAELARAPRDFEYPVSWGADLQSEHEKYLTGAVFDCPVIVTDYPMELKAFYMKCNADGRTVRAMDVLVPRLGEIIGGSERENCAGVLQRRIEACGLDPREYRWYLDLRRFGSVPHAGFGLGFERAVQFVTGMQNIRDVIAFPRAVGQLGF